MPPEFQSQSDGSSGREEGVRLALSAGERVNSDSMLETQIPSGNPSFHIQCVPTPATLGHAHSLSFVTHRLLNYRGIHPMSGRSGRLPMKQFAKKKNDGRFCHGDFRLTTEPEPNCPPRPTTVEERTFLTSRLPPSLDPNYPPFPLWLHFTPPHSPFCTGIRGGDRPIVGQAPSR